MKSEIKLSEITSREKLARLVDDFREDILGGEVNPLMAAAILKALEDFTKKLRGDILVCDVIREELDKYPEKVVHFNEVTFTKKRTPARYDYSVCNDRELPELESRMTALKTEIEIRQKFLQNVRTNGVPTIDEQTGEVYTIYPPAKQYEDSYSVTLNDSTYRKPARPEMNEWFNDRYCDANGTTFTDADPGL